MNVAVNTAPTANAVSVSTNEDTPVAITLSGSDAQQCELTFSIVSGPTSGSLGSITNNSCTAGSPNTDTASVTYTPNSNFCGSDTFTYKVNDGSLDSSAATVTITVTAVDDPPMAVDDAATVAEDAGATAIDVLANDTDVDGGPKTIASVTQPANGTVVDHRRRHRPDLPAGRRTTATTRRRRPTPSPTRSNGGSTATVTRDGHLRRRRPGRRSTTRRRWPRTSGATAIDVLANDTDVDGGPKTIASVDPAGQRHRRSITGGGTGLTYEPDAELLQRPRRHRPTLHLHAQRRLDRDRVA